MNLETTNRAQRWLRGLLGVLMLWAAVSKLADPIEFLGSIYAYQLPLPGLLLQTAAVVLPWLELLCGLLLVAGLWVETALVLVTGLLVLFVVATGQAWMRGLEIGCGCFDLKIFGLSKNLPGLAHFVESVAFAFFRNLLLTALAALLLRQVTRPRSVPQAITGQ
jgi:putative oxidoreductase